MNSSDRPTDRHVPPRPCNDMALSTDVADFIFPTQHIKQTVSAADSGSQGHQRSCPNKATHILQIQRFIKTPKMAPKAIVVLSTAVALASYVTAHGFPAGVVVDGKYFQGYNPSMQYQSEQPELIAWATPQDISNGFIASSAYTTDDIICHLGATPGALSAPVKAGGTVDLQWTPEWPESHK